MPTADIDPGVYHYALDLLSPADCATTLARGL
jgi:hypothetical protein